MLSKTGKNFSEENVFGGENSQLIAVPNYRYIEKFIHLEIVL